MLIDLSNNEVYDMLKNGSTNQRNFIKTINNYGLNIEDVFNTIDDIINESIGTSNTIDDVLNMDLRSLLNGGVLYIATEKDYNHFNDFVYAIENFFSYELEPGVYLIIE